MMAPRYAATKPPRNYVLSAIEETLFGERGDRVGRRRCLINVFPYPMQRNEICLALITVLLSTYWSNWYHRSTQQTACLTEEWAPKASIMRSNAGTSFGAGRAAVVT